MDRFTFIVFLMSCCCYFSLPLPDIVMGWSAVCDCGISWSNSQHLLLDNCSFGLVARKTVLGVSEKESFKPFSLASETS